MNIVNKRKIQAMKKAIAAHVAVIAKERDKIRTILAEHEDLVDTLDDGIDSIEIGIDRISELL